MSKGRFDEQDLAAYAATEPTGAAQAAQVAEPARPPASVAETQVVAAPSPAA